MFFLTAANLEKYQGTKGPLKKRKRERDTHTHKLTDIFAKKYFPKRNQEKTTGPMQNVVHSTRHRFALLKERESSKRGGQLFYTE